MGASTDTIEVREHDPAWAGRFDAERDGLAAALGGLEARVEHIGSTSVPGLAAKPTIDVMLLTRTLADADEAARRIAAAGFTYVPEYEDVDLHGDYALPSRRFLYRGERPSREVNLHVYAEGDPEAERHVLFRDWLRATPGDRDAYAELKRRLATEHADVDGYTDAKTEFIRAAEQRAAAARAAAGGRALALGVVVAAPPDEVWPLVREAAGLARWYATTAEQQGDDELVLGFEEEYGYRRVVRCRIEEEQPGRRLALRWLRQDRSFDGQLVATVPALQAGSRWSDANMDGRLVTTVELVPEGSGTRVLLREAGYGHDARWDHTLVEHAAWWHHYLSDRLPTVAGGRIDERIELEVELAAAPERAWRALVSPGEQAQWLPEGMVLPTVPGVAAEAGWTGTQLRLTGHSAIRPRRLRVAWDAPAARGTMAQLTLLGRGGAETCRLQVRHDGWPEGGGVGRALERTQAAWAAAGERLADHVRRHGW